MPRITGQTMYSKLSVETESLNDVIQIKRIQSFCHMVITTPTVTSEDESHHHQQLTHARPHKMISSSLQCK